MSLLGRVLLVLVVLASSGCAAMGSGKIGVSLTAVNYTDEDYDVVGIARADDPEQLEAMERVAAYAGSGAMCCVSLPTQWRPGLKVVVKTRLGTKAKTYQEWAHEKIPLRTHELEVPRYEEPATLWVQILDGGKLAAVVSRYDPPNANWPGVVRGWPRPSLEFRQKVWDREMKLLQGDLADFQLEVKKGKNPNLYQDAIEVVTRKIKLLGARP
ncbi:hypothetical protein VI26_11005 [Chromobacterium sp. LK1]|uniref:DUF3304 domain-containing protein n=1 Tax=Chromobacterium sp. LK1 TaxID=1628193 RepID=UPI00065315E8|nr:DUF3304 domain-containing protein [Chromobacterium sp. LK1]KMN35539.1 hypothetical protein VI26_11005 [Chromobacterium sp. LK1]